MNAQPGANAEPNGTLGAFVCAAISGCGSGSKTNDINNNNGSCSSAAAADSSSSVTVTAETLLGPDTASLSTVWSLAPIMQTAAVLFYQQFCAQLQSPVPLAMVMDAVTMATKNFIHEVMLMVHQVTTAHTNQIAARVRAVEQWQYEVEAQMYARAQCQRPPAQPAPPRRLDNIVMAPAPAGVCRPLKRQYDQALAGVPVVARGAQEQRRWQAMQQPMQRMQQPMQQQLLLQQQQYAPTQQQCMPTQPTQPTQPTPHERWCEWVLRPKPAPAKKVTAATLLAKQRKANQAKEAKEANTAWVANIVSKVTAEVRAEANGEAQPVLPPAPQPQPQPQKMDAEEQQRLARIVRDKWTQRRVAFMLAATEQEKEEEEKKKKEKEEKEKEEKEKPVVVKIEKNEPDPQVAWLIQNDNALLHDVCGYDPAY